MGGTCSTPGKFGKCMQNLVWELEGEKHLEGLGVDEKWILKT
jgi:hypothetical protein